MLTAMQMAYHVKSYFKAENENYFVCYVGEHCDFTFSRDCLPSGKYYVQTTGLSRPWVECNNVDNIARELIRRWSELFPHAVHK